MIEFRQKEFGKFKAALKKTFDDPVKTTLAITSTGLAAANLGLNISKKKKDAELNKKQTQAMEDLTKAIKESTELTKSKSRSNNDVESRGLRGFFRRR
jgi:hypothetical protein